MPDYYVKYADLQMGFVCNSWIYVKCRFQSARFATRKARLQTRKPPSCIGKKRSDLQMESLSAARIFKCVLYSIGGLTILIIREVLIYSMEIV